MTWEMQFSREYSLHGWSILFEGLTDPALLKFAPALRNIKLLEDAFDHTSATAYYNFKQWETGVTQVFLKLFNDADKLELFIDTYENNVKSLREFISEIENIPVTSYTNQELINITKRTRRKLQPFTGVCVWGIWIIHEYLPLDKLIGQKISKINKEDKLAILTPPELAVFFHEETELRKLDLSNSRAVKNHLEKFSWIPCVDINYQPWTRKDLKIRQGGLKNTRLSIDLVRRDKLLDRYRQLISKLSPFERKIAEAVHWLIYFRDERNDIRFHANSCIAKIYKEVAKRLDISFSELCFLTDKEIISILKDRSKLTAYKKEIESRKHGYLLYKKGGVIKIVSGEKVSFLRKELGFNKMLGVEVNKGIPSYPGKVRGSIIIIKSDQDLKQMKSGLIMAAIHTRPHYLAAMRQARAIIADEGSLTSHAAIVARELKIPCIVGTKNATRVLKNGDYVEVDATRGTVKKIQ